MTRSPEDQKWEDGLRAECNTWRLSKGLPWFQHREDLALLARQTCLDYIEKKYYGHHDLKGQTISGRMTAAGIAWLHCQENIAWGNHSSVGDLFQGFLGSAQHLNTLSQPAYVMTGIGSIYCPTFEDYLMTDYSPQVTRHLEPARFTCQVFLDPKP